MRRAGFTLLELLVVVALLALLAGGVVASLGAGDDERGLDAAAAEVAAALRFARAEARRTGEPYGAAFTTSSEQVRVYRLDESVSPPTPDYSVRHPLDKRIYDLQFPAVPELARVDLESAVFWFEDVATAQSFVGFNPDGAPEYEDAAGVHRLVSGEVRVDVGGVERVIAVQPLTGRVTVQ